jgi:hypothetical protein
MTILDHTSDPLLDGDAGPGFSFSDWMLFAHMGVHDRQVMRTHYRRRIRVPVRDAARLCVRDVVARRADPRMN